MKQCPKCGNSYTDDTLSFCLADGSALIVADEQPTVFRGGDPNKTEQLPAAVTRQPNDAVRVTIPGTPNTAFQPTAPPPKKSRSALWIVLIAAVLLGGFVVIAAAGIVGLIYFTNSGSSNIAIATTPSPTPWSSPTATPNDKSSLEDEVAKLKKKLEDASNSNSDSEITIDDGDFGSMGQTANVNSPGDGFLALRNLPSADIGQRIAKVPHGAEVKIILCSEQNTTIAGRSGHWCMVTYNGQTGWVFDVWLSFATDSKN